MSLFLIGYLLCLGICIMLFAVRTMKDFDIDSFIAGFALTCFAITGIAP